MLSAALGALHRVADAVGVGDVPLPPGAAGPRARRAALGSAAWAVQTVSFCAVLLECLRLESYPSFMTVLHLLSATVTNSLPSIASQRARCGVAGSLALYHFACCAVSYGEMHLKGCFLLR